MMRCYAVVDTNVIVSALIAKNSDSPPRQVFRAMLSGDIISYYFGASGVKFGYFMLGSLLGVLPGLISVTVLGTSVSDPSSPLFIVSVVLIVAFFLLSLAGRAIYNKINARKNKKSEALDEGNTDDGGKLQ